MEETKRILVCKTDLAPVIHNTSKGNELRRYVCTVHPRLSEPRLSEPRLSERQMFFYIGFLQIINALSV